MCPPVDHSNPPPQNGPQCQVKFKVRYSLQTWPRGAARAGPPRVPWGPAAGPRPRVRPQPPAASPPEVVWEWSDAEKSTRDALRPSETTTIWSRGPKSGDFSPRSAGAPPKRSDGARLGVISLRRSTPTPPGGVTQPVVGVAPAVLAPRRAPPGRAVDPPRGRPGGATSVSCTSFYHSFYHSLDTVAHSVRVARCHEPSAFFDKWYI